MRARDLISALWLTAAIPLLSHPVLADTVYLFGKVGNSPVGVSLTRNKENLDGWYFYYSQAKEIRLEGKIDRDGAFHMQETVDGKKTGTFDGRVKKDQWVGQWHKPAGGKSLPFSLQENHDQLKKLRCSYDCTAEERVAKYRYTYRWKLKLAITDGVVKELTAVQGAYWDDKEEQTCVIDLMDLKQAPSDTGLLLRIRSGNPNEDSKHTIRIIGNKDILWIRFGDSSEEGNDCRSVGDTLFCSPRAFWNDIILDQRTHKCRALK